MEYKLSVRNGYNNEQDDASGSPPSSSPVPRRENDQVFGMEEVLHRLGGFSRFQLFVTIAILLIDLPAVMLTMNPLLTGTTHVPFHCDFKNGSYSNKIQENEICTFNCSGEIVPIGKPPYQSIVQEWNLICGKSWVTDTVISIQMAGNLLGSLGVAYCSDRFGRKPAFYINTVLMGITGVLCAFSTGPVFFAVARFLTGFSIGGSFSSHFNYLIEFLPARWRQICGCVSFWSLGEMLLGLIGYLIPTWRTLSWVTAFPAFVICLTVFFIPESPRWAFANNKSKLGKTALGQMSKWNGEKPLTEEEIKRLQASITQEKSLQEAQVGFNQIWKAFRNFKLLRILLVFALAWFSNAVVYFGISYNMKNISGDPYWNIFFLGMVDLPAELSGFYFSNKYGRRNTFIGYLVVSCVFLVAIPVLILEGTYVNEFPWLILVLSLAGKFFNEGSWAVMACFTSESFPTVCRSFSLSICSASSTIGGIIAPQLIGAPIPKAIPYAVFAVLSMISSIVSFSIPEMKGKPLVDV